MLDFFKQRDKQKHTLVSFTVTFMIGGFLGSVMIGVIGGLFIGLVKEFYDLSTSYKWFINICKVCRKGDFDILDVMANMLGIILASIAMLLLGVGL